jgi:hypothetical protein
MNRDAGRVAPDGHEEEIEAAEPVMLHRVDLLWEQRLEPPAKQEREVDVPGGEPPAPSSGE